MSFIVGGGQSGLAMGAGNTGVQIAAELSKTHTVLLAKSKPIKLPQSIAGKSFILVV
ncbi:hypothetical protein [Natribacillus halophilus]|uniref:Putative flavoprotein involved in K+ transport n=1 Tax=Natribacillus halophilus TaxID=549003 RepID=A0A1G8RDJ4_9BACI|nr:hypothetical protein [Natribacillus halophilus]SDJ15077.1 putative flavoprotein involved in K+ transport [Natribacillus halophilus]